MSPEPSSRGEFAHLAQHLCDTLFVRELTP